MNYFLVFIFGTMIGSFLNVCIYRMPRKKSVVLPRSFCPVCEKPIGWYDNVPILSYLFLRAKCRSCGAKIPLRYVLVEILTGLVGVILLAHASNYVDFAIEWFFVCVLIAVVFIDIEHGLIPDVFSVGGLAAGLVLSSFFVEGRYGFSRSAFLGSLIGAVVGGGSMYAMGFVGEKLFKREAVGGGDVKLMAMIGSFLGWELALLTFFIAPVLGLGQGVYAKVRENRTEIPYAPYIALSAFISLLYGKCIIEYLFPIM